MDDQLIETLLREGNETAPTELRKAIRTMVRDEMIVAEVSVQGRDPRRAVVGVAAAAAVVLAIGAIVVVGQRRDTTTTITDTVVPTSIGDTPATTPPTTTPSSTTPSIASVRADRYDDLPATNPTTVTLRPGVLWPMTDLANNRNLKGFTATEEQQGDETVRTVTYVRPICDILAMAETAEPAVVSLCEPVMIVEARFGATQPVQPQTMPTIPLTDDGEVWTYQSTNPNEYPLCMAKPEELCTGPVTLERQIGDVPITVTLTKAISGPSYGTEDRMVDGPGTYVELARSIYLFDEASGAPQPHPGFTPLDIMPSHEMPWFRGTLFGPVVAVTDDGKHELRAQNDGVAIALYTSGLDRPQTFPAEGPMAAPADSPIEFDWTGSRNRPSVFGITDPEVFEIVFESADGQRAVTATGELSGTFRSQFFIATLPWLWSPGGSDELTVLARDESGNEIACFNASAWGGVSWVGETCAPDEPTSSDDLDTVDNGEEGDLGLESPVSEVDEEPSVDNGEEGDLGLESPVSELDEGPSVDNAEERDSGLESPVSELDEAPSVDNAEDSQNIQPNSVAGVTIYGDGEISCPDHRADDESRPVGTIVYQPEKGGIRITVTLTDAAPNVTYGVELWRDTSCIAQAPFGFSDESMTTDGDGAGELDYLFRGIEPGTYRLNVNLVTGDFYEDPRHREMGTAQFTEFVVP